MRQTFPRYGVLALALLLSCNDSFSPDPDPVEPSFRAEVNRFAGEEFFAFIDPEAGLTVLVGLSHEQLLLGCADQPFTIDPATILEVIRPNGSIKFTIQQKDVALTVYPVTSDDLCGVLAVTTPLATGTGSVTRTNNDLTFSGNGAVTFGFSLVGAATTSAGESIRVHAKARAVELPSGDFKVLLEEITIH